MRLFYAPLLVASSLNLSVTQYHGSTGGHNETIGFDASTQQPVGYIDIENTDVV